MLSKCANGLIKQELLCTIGFVGSVYNGNKYLNIYTILNLNSQTNGQDAATKCSHPD